MTATNVEDVGAQPIFEKITDEATNHQLTQNNQPKEVEEEENKKSTVANDTESKESVKSKSENTNTVISNYIENIKITTSSLVLNINNKPNKEQLLNESNTKKQFSPVWRQTLCAAASILLTLTAGLTSGYSSILLPQLKNHATIPGDDTTASWIASIAALPMAPGCLLAGWMMERFGRKMSHYIICAPFLLGWIFIAFAKDLTFMLLGRFFTGICVGLLGPLGPVYIGECSDPKYRGFFLAGVSLAIAVGILISHILGTFMSWQTTAIVCTVFPVLSVVLLCLVPESPTWLISKGRIEEGIRAFSWLRGHSDEVNKELKSLMEKQKIAEAEPTLSIKEKLKTIQSPELLKPLLIMIVFFLTCQFAGVNAVAFYSIDIVEKAVGKGLDHYIAMLVIDSVRVAMSVVACIVCRRFGRRPLCFISGVWTALSLCGLALFLYCTRGTTATNLAWIPLSCLMSYICAISVGLVPLPWIMCGEVFPTRVRGLGSGISSATTFTAFFVVVKTTPAMMNGLGEVATFFIYGIVAMIGTGVLYFILPETKGKSLQEIEDKFKNNNKKCITKV